MKKVSKELIIGLSVIVAILILIFGIDYLKGINLFNPSNFYEVYYDNVDGLEKSAPVNLNGFKVGQVREVTMDYAKPGKLKVVLALDRDLRLPEGTAAELGQTMLSGAFINLRLGKGPAYLEKGSTLPVATASDLMTKVQTDILPAVETMMPKIDSLLSNVNRLVGDPALLASVQRLDGITGNLYNATSSLNSTMGGLNRSVPGIMNGASRSVTRIDSITSNLVALSAELKTLPLQPTMENVQNLTANLEAFSKTLNNPNSTLGKITSDPTLYNQLNQLSADIDSLIVDIKRNPKRYISIKLL